MKDKLLITVGLMVREWNVGVFTKIVVHKYRRWHGTVASQQQGSGFGASWPTGVSEWHRANTVSGQNLNDFVI